MSTLTSPTSAAFRTETPGSLRARWEEALTPVALAYERVIEYWLEGLSLPDWLWDADYDDRTGPPRCLVPDSLALAALDLAPALARPAGYEDMLTVGMEPTPEALGVALDRARAFHPAAFDWTTAPGCPRMVGARLNSLSAPPPYTVPVG